MTVLVRPTRHTFSLMEKAEDFSVCILPDGYQKDLHLCGTKSGRDLDKVEACSFKTKPGHTIKTRYLEVSSHHFECRIVHKHWLDHETLDPAIIKRYYPKRDFHMVYYGEILGIYGK